MDEAAFKKLVLNEFPMLRDDFAEWDDLEELDHLLVPEFRDFTQASIESQSFEVVSKCFELATVALTQGDDSLRNAIYTSYLEDLDFRSDAGKRAANLMPAELRQGRNDILDYDEKLLGRKYPTDDR